MKSIYKYKFQIADEFSIIMPPDAEILTCQFQGRDPVMWAVVELHVRGIQKRNFKIIGTGWEDENIDAKKYIATLQQGPLVWHVFEA